MTIGTPPVTILPVADRANKTGSELGRARVRWRVLFQIDPAQLHAASQASEAPRQKCVRRPSSPPTCASSPTGPKRGLRELTGSPRASQ
eukprot:scaffold61199_cov66-Phaeocystis_antarctica.AAC.3